MVNNVNKNAVVLLSGGLDSTTVLKIAKDNNYTIYALTFDYGQRHHAEIKAAKKVAQYFEVEEHIIAKIDLRAFGGSALTDNIDVPKGRTIEETSNGIPITYVPARNTIFLSFALAWAEVVEANDVFIGINAIDYSGYPDCRPEYLAAYQKMANLATKAGVNGYQKLKIHAPLVHLKKSEIIQKGLDIGVDYAMTISCYDPSSDSEPCGLCDACLLRLKGFEEIGIEDPAIYQTIVK